MQLQARRLDVRDEVFGERLNFDDGSHCSHRHERRLFCVYLMSAAGIARLSSLGTSVV